MTALDYRELLATATRRGPKTGAARSPRKFERNRRNAKAQSLAYRALAKLHPEEYRALYEQAQADIYAECGPLPELISQPSQKKGSQ